MNHLEPRQWKLRSDIEVDGHIAALKMETGLSEVTLRVCLMRGLLTPEAIRNFLSPTFESLCNPLKIRDMDLATERLAQARIKGERVRVYGDYDVDGTTGAALLSWVLRDFGFQFDATQPDRFKDGYGLNVRAVETAAS